MAFGAALLQNALSDDPQSFSDVLSNSLNTQLANAANANPVLSQTITPQAATLSSGGMQDLSQGGMSNLAMMGGGQGLNLPQQGQQPTFNFGGGQPQGAPAAPQAPQGQMPPQGAPQGQMPPQGAPQGQAPTGAPQLQAAPGQMTGAPGLQAPASGIQALGAPQTVPGTQIPQYQAPQVGAPTQIAGTTPTAGVPTVQNAPSPTIQANQAPDWSQQLQQNANNFNGLTSMLTQGNVPDDVKDEAKDRLYNLMGDERMKAQAAKILDGAANGNRRDVNDLARELQSNKEEGSYIKAIFYHRMGLTQLAQDEQNKLGAGSKYSSYMDADGNHYTVKLGGDGAVEKAFDPTGKAVDQNTLANLNANYMSMKGAATGQTMGFDKTGNVISHTVVPGTGRVIWKDETNQKLLTGAPEGYHQGKNQQEMLANTAYAQTLKKLGDINAKEVANGRAPIYSDEQKESMASDARNKIMGLSSTTYGGGGEGGVNPPAGTAPASTGQTAAQWAADNGIPVSPHGGDRTTQDQANQLAQWYQNGMKGTRPAEPGRSAHESGNAIDVPEAGRTPENRAKLEAAGFKNTVPNEPWHFERTAATKAPQVGANNPTIRDVQASNAKAIANYEMAPLKGGGTNSQNATTMAQVKAINPDWNESAWKTVEGYANPNSTVRKNIANLDTSVGHIQQFMNEASKVPSSGTSFWDTLTQQGQKYFNAPEVKNKEAMADLIAGEVIKAATGGNGGSGERQHLAQQMLRATTPQELSAVMNGQMDLANSRYQSLKNGYEQPTGLKNFDSKFISSATQQAMRQSEARQSGGQTSSLSPADRARAELERRRGGQ